MKNVPQDATHVYIQDGTYFKVGRDAAYYWTGLDWQESEYYSELNVLRQTDMFKNVQAVRGPEIGDLVMQDHAIRVIKELCLYDVAKVARLDNGQAVQFKDIFYRGVDKDKPKQRHKFELGKLADGVEVYCIGWCKNCQTYEYTLRYEKHDGGGFEKNLHEYEMISRYGDPCAKPSKVELPKGIRFVGEETGKKQEKQGCEQIKEETKTETKGEKMYNLLKNSIETQLKTIAGWAMLAVVVVLLMMLLSGVYSVGKTAVTYGLRGATAPLVDAGTAAGGAIWYGSAGKGAILPEGCVIGEGSVTCGDKTYTVVQ